MTDEAKLSMLNELLTWARRAPFYRERLPQEPLASLDELRQVPITTKEDLREQSPFCLVGLPPEERCDVYEFFGTYGRSVLHWYHRVAVCAPEHQAARR